MILRLGESSGSVVPSKGHAVIILKNGVVQEIRPIIEVVSK